MQIYAISDKLDVIEEEDETQSPYNKREKKYTLFTVLMEYAVCIHPEIQT